jgi:hypothetical protein
MSEDNTLAVSVRMEEHYPAEFKQHTRNAARRELVARLVDTLYQPGQPIYTVQILDEERPMDYGATEYRLYCKIYRVQERVVEVARMPAYSEMQWKDLSANAVDEVKRRIRNKIKRLFRH